MEQTRSTEGRKLLKDAKTGRFVAGTSGYGRQKGSRNKLGEAFIDDLYHDWVNNGAETLARLREEDPAAYVRVVAQVLPQKVEQDVNIGVKIVRLPEHLEPSQLEALYHQPKTIEHQKDMTNGDEN